jgi:BolA protein
VGEIAAEMTRRLEAALQPVRLEVVNDSARHAGHMGDDGSGESHFSVLVESAAFAGLNRVQRQRLVNAALGGMMEGRVHALALKCLAPGEHG